MFIGIQLYIRFSRFLILPHYIKGIYNCSGGPRNWDWVLSSRMAAVAVHVFVDKVCRCGSTIFNKLELTLSSLKYPVLSAEEAVNLEWRRKRISVLFPWQNWRKMSSYKYTMTKPITLCAGDRDWDCHTNRTHLDLSVFKVEKCLKHGIFFLK